MKRILVITDLLETEIKIQKRFLWIWWTLAATEISSSSSRFSIVEEIIWEWKMKFLITNVVRRYTYGGV